MRRERERGPLHIAAAIPAGATRLRRLSSFVELVDQRALEEDLRLDRRENLHRLALALLERAHPAGDGTTMPTWAFLAERLGCSRATVARLLALLKSWGLLGVVATGRSGACAPGGSLARMKVHHSQVPATTAGNEAAVYVLCQPRHLAAISAEEEAQQPRDSAPVDTNETPPPIGVRVSPRTRAPETQPTQAEPLRGPNHRATSWPPTGAAWRTDPLWSSSITPSGKDNMLLAAGELQRRLPILRHITDRHVRSILRAFFLAGWTLGDVQLAIDRKPTDQPWSHDGAHGVGNVGAWLTYRLSAWRTHTGTVRRSPSQHAAAQHTEVRARSRARLQAEQEVSDYIHANQHTVTEAHNRATTWWRDFFTGRTTAPFTE